MTYRVFSIRQYLLKEIMYINKYNFGITQTRNKENINDYFECDDIIAPAISLLNRKGYKTLFCCSGHPSPYRYGRDDYFKMDLYVVFDNQYKFPELPQELYIDESSKLDKKGRLVIRTKQEFNMTFSESDYFNSLEKIFELNKKFYHWVEALEDINNR